MAHTALVPHHIRHDFAAEDREAVRNSPLRISGRPGSSLAGSIGDPSISSAWSRSVRRENENMKQKVGKYRRDQ